MTKTIPVSYLFVPGNRPDRFDKALNSGADKVILDLEDAVPPHEKQLARVNIKNWLNKERNVALRINSAETDWFFDDLFFCNAPGVDTIIISKASEVDQVNKVLDSGAKSINLLIESATGFKNMEKLSKIEKVTRLIFGTLDFQIDLGIKGKDNELNYFRSKIVLTSKLYNLNSPVDGVTTSLDNHKLIKQDTEYGKQFGFGAKLCIHPFQIPIVNSVYMPTKDQYEWAKKILKVAKDNKGSAAKFEGKMVDKPVITMAEEIINMFKEE
tara:strand:- start:912 stop:1718 length:807 start_codon:yes stop_codon:yes gene_type:complete